MQLTHDGLVAQLTRTAQTLPAEKLQETLDFMEFLQQRAAPPPSAAPRGSAQALMRYLGAWQFAPGELERILADLDDMREMEMEPHD